MVVILPFIYYPQILLDGDIDSYTPRRLKGGERSVARSEAE